MPTKTKRRSWQTWPTWQTRKKQAFFRRPEIPSSKKPWKMRVGQECLAGGKGALANRLPFILWLTQFRWAKERERIASDRLPASLGRLAAHGSKPPKNRVSAASPL
jgi:hypothetical protein